MQASAIGSPDTTDEVHGDTSADIEHSDLQEIRIAVVLNGGVSLAIWISGVTVELHHLDLASRGRLQNLPTYGLLLKLLGATARIDVVSGTSAGGLNGAFLALGLSRERDLGLLRDLWVEHGSLEKLLRPPLVKDPPSLLRGDDYFLPRVLDALRSVVGPKGDLPGSPSPSASEESRPIELVLTGTLWAGRSSSFTDDIGTGITEVDHDATFRFANSGLLRKAGGHLLDETVLEELAAACRCTSSFPGAFEPHWVEVKDTDRQDDGRWASKAGRANFAESQYVIDGGVLLNKPLRPALEAVHSQAADTQVRRVLAYVVPAPGEQPTAPAPAPTTPGPLPISREVLLGVLTRLRSTDSVSRELLEIRTRNEQAHSRRQERDQLSVAMTDTADALAADAWAGYRQVRIDSAAKTVGRLIAAGQHDTSGNWSDRELAAALRGRTLSFIPGDSFADPRESLDDAVQRSGDAWDWGQTTVQRLGDMAVDVLKRAVWLARMGTQQRLAIVDCRRVVHVTLARIREDRRALDAYWSGVANGSAYATYGVEAIPARRGAVTTAAANIADLESWLDDALAAWDAVPEPGSGAEAGLSRRAVLHGQALELAADLFGCASALVVVGDSSRPELDPDGSERRRLWALYECLLAGADNDVDVLHRMLRLDVVQLGFSGAVQDVEQEVELVQISAADQEQLTGVQLHHFGAFYRASWRMNDWLQGRMDGVTQIVRLVLSPERLRQMGWTVEASDATFPDDIERILTSELLQRVKEIATTPATPEMSGGLGWLEGQWALYEESCRSELATVVAAGAAPRSLDNCARAIARPLQLEILRKDIPQLAVAVRSEVDRTDTSTAWLAGYDAVANNWTAAAAWECWSEIGLIGEQRVVGDIGSDTFAKTASHTAAVAAAALGSSANIKAVSAVLQGFRGYTLMVWAMVTFLASHVRFGTRVVELALAAGGVLLAVTVLVPAVPLGLTLAGVLLLLAGLTAAALRTPGGAGLGWRLLIAAIIVAIALGGWLWWDISKNGSDGEAWKLLIKVATGLVIVLLGWWVATAQHNSDAAQLASGWKLLYRACAGLALLAVIAVVLGTLLWDWPTGSLVALLIATVLFVIVAVHSRNQLSSSPDE
jgi:patatin-related protein